MAELVLANLVKDYGSVNVIKNMNLAVHAGEFISFLGPSGCGKSTLLSMIAGLEAPTSGQILFQDRLLASPEEKIWVEPEHRHFGIVFQSYALWPHMTIEQNLAFPLNLRKMPADEQHRRIDEMLELVELKGLDKRYPGQLSGGQQQRVALARALVYRPQLLLLDEPLSNLDTLLREQARIWLKELQIRMGITTIYVTHDQSEALALSDRIVVMRSGIVEQIATPKDIYEKPASEFVASFVGSANFLKATVTNKASDAIEVMFADNSKATIATTHPFTQGQAVKVAIRPEHLHLDVTRVTTHTHDRHDKQDRQDRLQRPNQLKILIQRQAYMGSYFSYDGFLDTQYVHAFGDTALDAGEVVFYFSPLQAMVFSDT